MTIPLAPSAAPRSVRISEVTSSSITVHWGTHWGTVPCIHRNGDITGYSVQYGVVGGESVQNMPVSQDIRQTTLSGLISYTDYTVSVAAMNIKGTGVYSDGIIIKTNG